jgi:7-cyano-7-deazaguanine synthase
MAVVLLSGGMDSCVTVAIARKTYDVALVHASYGQHAARRERQAFDEIADFYGVRERLVVPMNHLAEIGSAVLTDAHFPVSENGSVPTPTIFLGDDRIVDSLDQVELVMAIEEAYGFEVPDEDGEKIRSMSDALAYIRRHGLRNSSNGNTSTYVPFRNAHILAVAVSWAEVIGARAVFIGADAEGNSGDPACRPKYYRAFQQLVREGAGTGPHIEIMTPVIGMRKWEIVKRGMELGAPLDRSWSCSQFEDEACGECENCRLRLSAFAKAGIRDPIAYQARVER